MYDVMWGRVWCGGMDRVVTAVVEVLGVCFNTFVSICFAVGFLVFAR